MYLIEDKAEVINKKSPIGIPAQELFYVDEYENMDFSDLEDRYDNVEKYIRSICSGQLRSMIVNGPPGVGKTFSVDAYLAQYAQAGNYKVVAGHMTLLTLYANLYHLRDTGQILVLDDVDSVYSQVTGLNILKAAMDTKPVRRISWESSSAALAGLGLPNSFEYKGSVILISNIGFSHGKGKLNVHLDALKDRSFALQISDGMRTSLYHQVCFMVIKKDLLKEFNLTFSQKARILDYIHDHLDKLHKISLRLAIKLASLMVNSPSDWHSMADSGLLSEYY